MLIALYPILVLRIYLGMLDYLYSPRCARRPWCIGSEDQDHCEYCEGGGLSGSADGAWGLGRMSFAATRDSFTGTLLHE